MLEITIIGGLSCLVCLLVMGVWYYTQREQTSSGGDTHTGIEVLMWRDVNPSATLNDMIAKAKEIEAKNREPAPVLLMTRQQLTDAHKQYLKTKSDRRTFLVILSDEVLKSENDTGAPPLSKGIDYAYLSQSFPYQTYVV